MGASKDKTCRLRLRLNKILHKTRTKRFPTKFVFGKQYLKNIWDCLLCTLSKVHFSPQMHQNQAICKNVKSGTARRPIEARRLLYVAIHRERNLVLLIPGPLSRQVNRRPRARAVSRKRQELEQYIFISFTQNFTQFNFVRTYFGLKMQRPIHDFMIFTILFLRYWPDVVNLRASNCRRT